MNVSSSGADMTSGCTGVQFSVSWKTGIMCGSCFVLLILPLQLKEEPWQLARWCTPRWCRCKHWGWSTRWCWARWRMRNTGGTRWPGSGPPRQGSCKGWTTLQPPEQRQACSKDCSNNPMLKLSCYSTHLKIFQPRGLLCLQLVHLRVEKWPILQLGQAWEPQCG